MNLCARNRPAEVRVAFIKNGPCFKLFLFSVMTADSYYVLPSRQCWTNNIIILSWRVPLNSEMFNDLI